MPGAGAISAERLSVPVRHFDVNSGRDSGVDGGREIAGSVLPAAHPPNTQLPQRIFRRPMFLKRLAESVRGGDFPFPLPQIPANRIKKPISQYMYAPLKTFNGQIFCTKITHYHRHFVARLNQATGIGKQDIVYFPFMGLIQRLAHLSHFGRTGND